MRGGKVRCRVRFGVFNSAVGLLAVACTEDGLCFVGIGNDREGLELAAKSHLAGCDVHEELEAENAPGPAGVLLEYLAGKRAWSAHEMPCDAISSTPFQRCVWAALRQIPPGYTCTYSSLAEAVGSPDAARAVASACANNPIAIAIPCHRVLPASGGIGDYLWGSDLKDKLLALEAASCAFTSGKAA